MRAYWAKSAAAHILYHDLPGDGVPLVFLHGLGCASSCDYPRVVADPAFAGHRAILVDLLGSGFSERPSTFGYTVADHARCVTDLVLDAHPGPVRIFGHSMGGAVAITLATLLGERVTDLVLSEPNLDPGGGAFSRRIAAMTEADYVARGHADTVGAARVQGNVVWAASLAVSAPTAVYRGAASLVAGSVPTWRTMLRELSCRRTVVFGTRSLPEADVDGLAEHGCAIEVVEEAGHSMAWENPTGLAAALARALS